MIDVIITSYNEPKTTLRAVETFLKQSHRKDLRVTVVDPFPEVETFLRKNVKDERFNFYLDSGEGKSYALNLLFQELGSSNSDDIFVLTDGDVFVSDKTISAITKAFTDKKTGCITGRPVSVDGRDSKYGYWAHLFFAGIDRARRYYSKENLFFECSGYLFAIRKNVISDFPMNTSEDSIIPYLFWKKNYAIRYVPEAEVYVKNPTNWKDWLAQKVRNVKAHENLNLIAPDMPRTKSLFNEIRWGLLFALMFPRSFKEAWWTFEAIGARLYLYYKAHSDMKSKKSYEDGWRGQHVTESTKLLD